MKRNNLFESKWFGGAALALGLVGCAMKLTAIFTFDHYIIREFPDLIHKWNYLGFFTYTTNIMVDFWLILVGVSILFHLNALKQFLTTASLQSFLTAMIVIVGVLYCSTMLWFDTPYSRALWWGNVVTFWHHVVTPACMVYLFFRPADKARLGMKNMALWMIYPFSYFLVTMVRGGIVHWYPYPFLDSGWETFADLRLTPWVGISVVFVVLLGFMLGVGLLAVKLHNRTAQKTAPASNRTKSGD